MVGDGESPSRGLSKGPSAGMRGPPDCDGEKEDRIDEGALSVRVVEASACASAGRESSAFINGPKEGVAVGSAI